jgi:hypothetical protein
MMVCPSCGEPVTSDAFRCTHCGARLLLAAHHAPPAPKPKAKPFARPAPAAPKPHSPPHHAPAAPPDLPVAPLKGVPRQPPPRRRPPAQSAPPIRMRSISKMSRVALAGAVLIGIVVTRSWASGDFVGSGASSQSSGFDTSQVPNATTTYAYTAPGGSFFAYFPGVPAELPDAVHTWNGVPHLTHQVEAATGNGFSSRVSYAELGATELATDFDTYYKSLCRSLGSHAADTKDVVDGAEAMRCQVNNGTNVVDHELVRRGGYVFDISSTYANDDLAAADAHDAFVSSFRFFGTG